ncbi:MAG: hypothetical protein HUU30_15270 [Burkholderiaceae bacterium]|nr:hypothetical protein [Burkholderiaceae bacterium]
MHQPIVILASSRKNGGICLAGKRLGMGEWVRPVSVQPGQAWSVRSLHLLAGCVPQVGERFVLPLGHGVPDAYQRENCSVRFTRWQAAGRMSARELEGLADQPATLWLNGWQSVHGWNDRIPEHVAAQRCDSSLLLIRPETLRFRLDQGGGKLALRAVFDYRGQRYDLKVTDDRVCGLWIERLADGHDGRADALLCVSLGQAFYDYCYKLVASVIELPPPGST